MPLPGTLASSTSSGSATFSVVRMSLPTFVQTRHCAALPDLLKPSPSRSSALPNPYSGAVSKSRKPAATHFSTISAAAASPIDVPMPPSGEVPMMTSETPKAVLRRASGFAAMAAMAVAV